MLAEIFNVGTSNTVKIVQLSDVKASSDGVMNLLNFNVQFVFNKLIFIFVTRHLM